MLEWEHGGDNMTVGDNIKTIRKKKGIKQKDLASYIEMTVRGLQDIEYGKTQPRVGTVLKIAKCLNVSPTIINPDLNWNDYIDTESLSNEVQVWDSLPDYNEDDIDIFRSFLSLNPDGKQKASEYIDLLMLKYKDK